MEKIRNDKLLDELYTKHNIDKLFATEFKKDLILIKFEKGEYIQREGDVVEDLLFLVEGSAKVSIDHENGKSKLICFIDEFEMIGDIELFAASDYTYQIIAMKETYCLALNLKKYRDILLNDVIFTKYMAKEMAKIVLDNNKSTSFNLLYSIETRVATYILLTAKDGYFKDNLTLVAELLAISYRHLHRTLAGLCCKGVLKKEGRKYKIMDEVTLNNLANETISQL